MTGAPNGAAPRAASISRRQAALVIIVLTAVGLFLRVWELDSGLPLVLHTDHAQVEQAAELVATGGYTDRAPYPPANVLVLAALDAAVGRVGVWTGRAPWSDWNGFLATLSQSGLAHLVARWWSALAGALIAPVAYKLARVALGRGPALLAAASVALCPIAVATSHQARIHAPGVTLLALAAIPALRAVRRPSVRRALIAGVATGAAAGFIQLGVLLAAATVLQLVVVARPAGRALRLAAVYALATVAVMASLEGLAHVVADVRPGHGGLPTDTSLTLGIPAVTLGLHWERLPRLAATWALGEPVRAALAVLGAVTAALAGPRRVALLYATYPLLALVVLGTNYTQARYVLSLTPLLAPLAVLGLRQLALRPVRVAAAALLVVSPLAASIRYDWLLSAGDTRLQLAAAIGELEHPGGPALVEDRLLLRGVPSPPDVGRFPANGDFLPWMRGETTRRETFEAIGPVVFVREPVAGNRLEPEVVTRAGLRLVGLLEPGALGDSDLPDPTEAMAIDVWRARCSGPVIEIWALPGEPTRVAQRLLRSR